MEKESTMSKGQKQTTKARNQVYLRGQEKPPRRKRESAEKDLLSLPCSMETYSIELWMPSDFGIPTRV